MFTDQTREYLSDRCHPWSIVSILDVMIRLLPLTKQSTNNQRAVLNNYPSAKMGVTPHY
jgi:hypothetical protein